MYGPNVTILLMYESHDMRHTGFCRLTVVNGTLRNRGVTYGSPLAVGIHFIDFAESDDRIHKFS